MLGLETVLLAVRLAVPELEVAPELECEVLEVEAELEFPLSLEVAMVGTDVSTEEGAVLLEARSVQQRQRSCWKRMSENYFSDYAYNY